MKNVAQQARGAMETSLILIGNEARNHFVANFKKQGFDDKSVEKWTPRKKNDKRAGRNILVKSGDLRRSIQVRGYSKTKLSIIIATDLKYAKIHNFGGTIEKQARKGVVNFKILKNGKSRFAKRSKANFQQDVVFKEHEIKMHKREFIGDSYNLNEKVKKIIIKQLDSKIK
jgi:phage gpG-like protein